MFDFQINHLVEQIGDTQNNVVHIWELRKHYIHDVYKSLSFYILSSLLVSFICLFLMFLILIFSSLLLFKINTFSIIYILFVTANPCMIFSNMNINTIRFRIALYYRYDQEYLSTDTP